MKRFLSVVTAAAMALSTMTAFGASENQAIAEPNNNGRHVDAGYLVRDSFPYYQSGNWEFKGEWLPSNETIAMLADTSADSYTEMERIFIQKSSGIVTAEFRIIPVMGSSGAYYTFRDSSTGEDAVTISVEQTGSKYDQCYYVKEDGEKQFIGELPNTDITVAQKNDSIGFKIVMDIDTKTVDIYFNGELKVDGENFTNPEVTGVGTIAFGISREGKGIYQPGTLNIYTGYGVYEDFVSANPVEFSNPEWNYVQNLPVWVFNAGYSLSDGTIPNSNNDEKWMGNDGNLTTYWEGNLPDPNDPATLPYSLPFDKSCYLLETEGQLLKINKIVITEPDHRADTYQLCYNYADGTEWGAWRYIGFDGENFDLNAPPDTYIDSDLLPLSTPDHQIVITLPEPIYCRMIGINFGTPVEEGMKPAVSEFVAYYDAAADPNANLIDENNLPDDWTVTGPDGSVQVVQSSRYSKAQDYNVISFKDASNEQAAYMEQNFTLIDGNKGVSIDFDMLLQSTQSKGAEVVVTQDNGNELRLYAQGDEIFVAATGMEEPISILQGCKTNIWQHFQMKYQKDTGTLQVTKDGSSPENAEAISLPESFQTGNFYHVSLGFSEEAVGEAQFDNIRILALVNENVVPEPQPVDTGDTIVQAQICTLWRDGSAHGWKYVDGRDEETGEALFLDRKPILGWYDESDPEVTDWQIKWAVEHGISSFMYCWYRNNTGPIPTKETMCTDALYYGQYNAKYRDYMKYTIMWENTTGYGMYGAEDLLENLMPHWIETVFKNPNYLKTTDNKPILYIYDYSVLMQQVGDFDNNGVPNEYSDVRKLFDEMRQMCVDAGFGGLVIATEDRHASSSRISDISQCGFDNIFQYCYTVDRPNPTDNDMFNSIQNTLYTQLEGVENAPGDNKPGIVPSVSMGWDYTPWAEIYGVTEDQFETVFSYSYRFDYDAYHQLAEWVRDTFLNTEGVATFGTEETGIQKMVMLDNWNEFGEGHYIMPTAQYGYGYLYAVKQTFADRWQKD